MTTSTKRNDATATAVKIGGIVLFIIGIFFTIGAIISLPFFFVILFALVIVAGIVMIRWANKRKQQQKQKFGEGW